jgi:nuclear pore complex protein Nup62
MSNMGFNFGSNTPNSGGASGANPFGNAGSNNNQQQPKPLFGGTSTPSGGGSGSNIFGGAGNTTPAAAPAGGNIFGSAAAGGGQQSNAFGSGTSTPGSLFGAKPAATNGGEQKNVFGGGSTTPQATPGNLFGSAAPAASGGEQKTGGSLFGSAAPAQSGTTTPLGGGFSFGQKKEEPKQTPAAGASLFGGTPANTQQSTTPSTNPPAGGSMFSSNIFGQNKPQAAPPSSGSNLFGGVQAPAAGQESKAPTPNLFGPAASTAKPAAGAAAGGNLFAGLGSKDAPSGTSTPQANKTTPSTSFTPAGNPPTGNFFGGGAAGAKPSLFTQPPKADENKAPATGAGDAQPKSSTQFAGFSNLGGGAGGSTATSLFGEKKPEAGKDAQPTTEKSAEAAKPSPFGNAFGKKPETPASSAPGSTSNLFGGLGATSSSSAQPATGTATSGAATGSNTFGGSATSSAKPAESTPKAAATPANSGGASLFGKPETEKPATQQPTAQQSTAQQPAQTAEPTSRLVGKSLDEILTSWSTSLATHQSRFAKLADQVGAWDRELTSNSTSISKLYSRCFQAERDVAEVERQLSTVEQGQRELGSRLDKYEAEVDGLLEQAGLGDAGGVDRERETTYKAAEACSDRLMEMNQSLTAMIEGINDASTKLSSSSASSGKAAKDAGEDPLSQIVRVLNSHLAQLQVIDSGAADLSKRVEAAQVDAGVAGSRLGASMRGSMMGGGGGNDVAEGFKKSFFRSGDRY